MSDLGTFFLSVKDVQWLDFKKIFNWTYLSDTALPLSSPLVALLGYFFLILIIAGIVVNLIISKKNKKLPIYSAIMTHITNLTMWLGIIGIIAVLARYQGISILSSRIILLLDLLMIIIWKVWIFIYFLKVIPKKAKEYKKQQALDKYLPKKKKIRL